MSEISIIVAVAENGVIGKDNQLIWHLADDMNHFKNTTLDSVVITGRKNYESIPEKYRPLPRRKNIVITNQKNYHAPGCVISHSFEDAIENAKQNNGKRIFIIGGGEIYKLAIEKKIADKIFLSRVHCKPEGDTFFPEIDSSHYKLVKSEFHAKNERNDYDFTVELYEKLK